MKAFKHWKRDEGQPKTINFDLITNDKNKISVHVTEFWNAEDTGNVMFDFEIQTECGKIIECIYIPREAFKELFKIQKLAKVTRKP